MHITIRLCVNDLLCLNWGDDDGDDADGHGDDDNDDDYDDDVGDDNSDDDDQIGGDDHDELNDEEQLIAKVAIPPLYILSYINIHIYENVMMCNHIWTYGWIATTWQALSSLGSFVNS